MKLFCITNNITKFEDQYFIFFKEEETDNTYIILVLNFEDVQVNFRTAKFKLGTDMKIEYSFIGTRDLEKRITWIHCVKKILQSETFDEMVRSLSGYGYQKIELYSFVFNKEIIEEVKKLEEKFKDKINEDKTLKKAVLLLMKEIGLEETNGIGN